MENYRPRTTEEEVTYELTFDDGMYNGFGFPCDAEGNIPEDMNEAAKKNLAYCLEHPEKFVRFNKVVKFVRRIRVPARGTCKCGADIALYDEYYGACQCPYCGQWYNTSGQELLPPDKWGWDGTPW